MADTIVRVYPTETPVRTYPSETRVITEGSGLIWPYVNQATAAAADAVAAKEAIDILIEDAMVNITVDASLVLRPEDNGGANAVGLAAACTAASAAAGVVALSPGTVYLIDREVIVPAGVNIIGPRAASLKLPNQVSATLVAGFTSGTAAKTFKLSAADAALFSVGQTVMFANTTTHATSPNDPFSHAGRQISAKVDNGDGTWNVTIGAGPNVLAHAAGDIVATTSHLLRLAGANRLIGFTLDGNEANQTYAHWVNSTLIAQEGDDCYFRHLLIKDTPSDAILPGGPSAGVIKGSWTQACVFKNIGGNGVHYGNAQQLFVDFCRFVDGNMRYALPVEQGGGASTRAGHQDGAITFSNDCRDLTATGNYIENFCYGIASIGSTGSVFGDKVRSFCNTFVNCNGPYEVTGKSVDFTAVGDQSRATYPFPRWATHKAFLSGDDDVNFVRRVELLGFTMVNGYLEAQNLVDSRFDVTIDNSGSMAEWTSGGFRLLNFEGVIADITVRGGTTGLYLQNAYATRGRASVLRVNLMDQKVRAQSGALIGGATMALSITGSVRATSGISNNDWVGITHLTGMREIAVDAAYDGGITAATPFSGGSAAANRRNCSVNGVFE